MDINQIKEDYVIRNLCREAKIMSKLNHPCIAALYQTMQRSDNVYYLVTELVSGGDLCSFVKGQHGGKLEERPTRIYARQFASALSHMHSLGIVHRDLKMENVMLNSIQTQIKIVDFGLSNVWSADNPLRTHCGSPEYAAPELFVTGKQYGAEVDLWSLGIILYGMVKGHLPFVSSRTDYASSQERRRKLVAKINKGLAAPHRRALASYSPEFRHVLGRLLAADSSVRMSTKELMVHPWITDKGRRLVRTNPIKMLDSHWQAKIVTEIGTLMQADPKTVMSAIAQDPLGKVGGMFNILAHKHQINQLSGDGVTRTLPSLTSLEIPSEKQKKGPKQDGMLRVFTARTAQEKKPCTCNTRQSVIFTPRVVDRKNIKINLNLHTNRSSVRHKVSTTSSSKKENNVPKVRPNTVQAEKSSPVPDYRLIKASNLRRKTYSATITPKTNPVSSPVAERRKQISTLPVKNPSPNSGDTVKKENEVSRSGKKGIQEALNIVRRTPQTVPNQQSSTQPQQHRDSHLRIHTANAEKPRSKSDHLAGTKRPLTGPLNRVVDRSVKQTSAPPVTVSYSVSRTVENRSSLNNRPSRQKREGVESRPGPWERSMMASGDAAPRSPKVAVKPTRKPIICDPIARSIADYVANNVPGRLHNFSWFNKKQS